MQSKLYQQTEYKKRRAKQYERDRADKDLHGRDGSKHQRNRMLAKMRRNEEDEYAYM